MNKLKAVHMAVMDAELIILKGGTVTICPMDDRIRMHKSLPEDDQGALSLDYPFEPPREAPPRGSYIVWETPAGPQLGFSSGVLEEGRCDEGWLRVYYESIDMDTRVPDVAVENWTELRAVSKEEKVQQ